MIIWLLLIIPILSVTFLLIKFHKSVTWGEAVSQLLFAVFLIFMSKLMAEHLFIYDKEYWGSLVKQVEYYEEWNEYISQICTTTDSKGNVSTYDCSYVDYNPERWIAKLTDGRAIHITKSLYNEIVQKFKNKKFVDLYRNYHSKDGDLYVSKWCGEKSNFHLIVTNHIYENRVQASSSVFKFPVVSHEETKRYELYEYPDIENYDVPTILGNWPNSKKIENDLKWLNGKYGSSKQIRLWVLIFKNQPKMAGQLQEFFMDGGNKNEFVICIGSDSENRINWVHPFSWTENQTMKIETRNFIMGSKTLDSLDLVPFLENQIQTNWKRKEFKDFKYLTVDPPLWALITAFCIQIVFNVLYGWWIVINDLK